MTITNENRYGPFKNDVIEIGGGGGAGYMQTATSARKKITFLFSLEHGQRGSSWALISIPLVVLFRALAWVAVTSLYCPSSKDNDPEYACAYSENMHDKSLIGTTFESNPAPLQQCCWQRWIWNRECWIPCMKVFLMDTFESTWVKGSLGN